ncbi:hypothetical protein MYX77_03065 [Acidobacteriia bacterium AH_259_A11_L15]|nr:hypothetical protein [Acidobacteriia bacterium AH_259_A11_L15]
MKSIFLTVAVGFLFVGTVGCENPETAELRARLERENDPGERAKLAVKIGENLLEEVGRTYQEGDYEAGEERLAEYLDVLRQAHQELEASGRDARRHPKGFKELEIHLRKRRRELRDLARHLPFHQRAPVEQAIAEMGEMRTALLSALMNVELQRIGGGEKEEERQ